MTDRRRMAGKFEQRLNQGGIDGIAAKPANVAAPKHKVAKRIAKRLIE